MGEKSAFPLTLAIGPAGDVYSASEDDAGMSLRDWFAGMALQGLMANPERYKYIAELLELTTLTQDEATEKNVNKAYMIADAMLERRETGPQGSYG